MEPLKLFEELTQDEMNQAIGDIAQNLIIAKEQTIEQTSLITINLVGYMLYVFLKDIKHDPLIAEFFTYFSDQCMKVFLSYMEDAESKVVSN